MAEGLDPLEFLRLSREKSRPGRRRRRRRIRIETRMMMGCGDNIWAGEDFANMWRAEFHREIDQTGPAPRRRDK